MLCYSVTGSPELESACDGNGDSILADRRTPMRVVSAGSEITEVSVTRNSRDWVLDGMSISSCYFK
jgi:hypothetical protein